MKRHGATSGAPEDYPLVPTTDETVEDGARTVVAGELTHSKESVWKEEKWNLLLLTTLYMIQGVPLGLTSGSMYELGSQISLAPVRH